MGARFISILPPWVLKEEDKDGEVPQGPFCHNKEYYSALKKHNIDSKIGPQRKMELLNMIRRLIMNDEFSVVANSLVS